MKKQWKTMMALGAAAAMTMAAVITAHAEQWKDDARGWWVERDDGSYLVNEWYRSPSSGLWYYMGPDGYMLTNATTPDGYYVGADGVWNQGTNAGTTQQGAANPKNIAAAREAAEEFKVWAKNQTNIDSYVFCDIDGDAYPECIATNGTLSYVLTYREGKSVKPNYIINDYPFYVPGKNVFCRYSESIANDIELSEGRTFYEINENGLLKEIGESYARLYNGVYYRTQSRSNTSKAIYDEYNDSFGDLVEISIEYEDTYRSIDAACDAYLSN